MKQRELPWQPNLVINKPKLQGLHFCARNRVLFRTNSKVFGVGVFKYAIKISRAPRELPWQPKLGKTSENCTNFSSVQETEEFITSLKGFWGRRIRIWHIKFHGNQGGCHGNQIWGKKLHSSVLCKKSRNLLHVAYSGDFGAGEFQYAIRIFTEAKGVAMATKFEQK